MRDTAEGARKGESKLDSSGVDVQNRGKLEGGLWRAEESYREKCRKL